MNINATVTHFLLDHLLESGTSLVCNKIQTIIHTTKASDHPWLHNWSLFKNSFSLSFKSHSWSCQLHWSVQSQAHLVHYPHQSCMLKMFCPLPKLNSLLTAHLLSVYVEVFELVSQLSVQNITYKLQHWLLFIYLIYINFKEVGVFFSSNLRSQHYSALSKWIVCNERFYISVNFQSKYHLFCYQGFSWMLWGLKGWACDS